MDLSSIMSFIFKIVKKLISIIPQLVILFVVIYVLKLLYNNFIKYWRQGFSLINDKSTCKKKENGECDCI